MPSLVATGDEDDRKVALTLLRCDELRHLRKNRLHRRVVERLIGGKVPAACGTIWFE